MVATVQAEKQILWHPRSQSKFVVGGSSQISLYEWAPEQSEIRHLSSRSDLSFMKCFAWSPDTAFDDLFAVGLVSGRRQQGWLAIMCLSSGPVAALPVRNSRSCNTLAFCQTDPNYLAVGLDKVRGDPSLIVWDVQTQDVGPRADPRMLQQHAPTEVVSALSFLPQSTCLLLAGMSFRWFRLFDLRSPTKVSGIATNVIDPHQVACCGDGTVTIWDIRKTRRTYGSGISGAVNAADTSEGERSRDSSQSRVPRRSWTNLPWTAPGFGAGVGISEFQDPSSVVLADTRKTKHFGRPLASFALVPDTHPFSATTEAMVVTRDGDLELYALHDTPKQSTWSSRGDLVIGAGLSCKIFPGFQDQGNPSHPSDVSTDRIGEEPIPFGNGGVDGSLVSRRGANEFPALLTACVADRGQYKLQTYSPASFGQYPLKTSPTRPEATSHYERSVERLSQGQDGERIQLKVPTEKNSLRNRKSASCTIQRVVEDDVSMAMRTRAIRGYGVSNAVYNAKLTRTDPFGRNGLSELWAWILHSRGLLCFPTSRIHGYDFSNQGLQGIWDGFPAPPRAAAARNKSTISLPAELHSTSFETTAADTNSSGTPSPTDFPGLLGVSSQTTEDVFYGDFDGAVGLLLSRQNPARLPLSPSLRTKKTKRRQFALQLCGWSLADEDLSSVIQKWEREGQFTRAACWLVFTKQYTKALEVLMRSEDETHHLIAGTLAALVPGGSKSSELHELSERLIVRLLDPYVRAMLTQLTSKDWTDVLEEEALPLRERLAISFQFLEDRALSSYLHRTVERLISRGDIEGLIITGLTPSGMHILQSYVDHTGDVQTAAILSSYVCPARFQDPRAEMWQEAYRDLLDGFKLFHHRVNFDIGRGQILQEAVRNGDLPPTYEWVPRHMLIRCNYCSKPVNPSDASAPSNNRVTACPNCDRALPRCCVCLMTLSVVPDSRRNANLLKSHSASKDTIEDAIIICQTCRHGGHASHILEWFFGEEGAGSHGICPVAECNCRCGDEL
ncbi:hypothetical protein EDC04DRAFT_2702091 [Pisolithus marmoratus]|nr:hypothetical protein EDC04DRAFT_2702091 [Pisolithus marmoratus]